MKKINVLMDLQLSSISDGKFLITPDSNVNVAAFTIKHMLKIFPGKYRFYLLVPMKNQIIEGKSFSSLMTDDLKNYEENGEVVYVEYNYFNNPFVDRMTFNSESISKEFKEIVREVDIVYTNDPCKVLNYKTLFYYIKNEMIPVISRNHWVSGKSDRKVPEEIDFFMRQVEGANVGEFMSFNSKFAINLFLENSKEYFNEEFVSSFKKKLRAFDTVDVEKVDKHKNDGKFSKFTILWAHRLSYYTGWKETLDSLLELWKERKDFQVIVPDPGNKTTQKMLKEKYPFIMEIDKASWTHEEYLRTCWKCDLVLGNHKYPATWGGLAITEPMAAGVIPIMPKRHAYTEMFFEDSNVFFKDEEDMNRAISYFIDLKEYEPEKFEIYKQKSREFCSHQLSIKQFVRNIDNLINLCIQS